MTTAPAPKNRYLQSLSNIDLAHRKKKVITTPTRPPVAAVKQQRVLPKDLPVVALFTKPIEKVVEDTVAVAKPTHVRRIYEREFLLKFKYAYTDFPAGVATPEELVAQYNRDFEVKERQAALEFSLVPKKSPQRPQAEIEIPKPLVATLASESTLVVPPVSTVPKRKKLSADDNTTELKLRIPSSNANISRLGMFSAAKPAVKAPILSSQSQDNKENRESAAVSKVSAPAASTPAKKPKQVTAAPASPIVAIPTPVASAPVVLSLIHI